MERVLAAKRRFMCYNIRYATKRGGSGMETVSTNQKATEILLSKFKQRVTAIVEKKTDSGKVVRIGECYKLEGRWQWYIDTEA